MDLETMDAFLENAFGDAPYGEAKAATRKALGRLHRFHKPAHAEIVSSWAALYRLQATIRCCVFTIRNGFHFESACLLRLFIEQLAWVAGVYRHKEFDSIFKMEPNRLLPALKAVFPRAGYVYGSLSEKAHITPEQTKRCIDSNDEGQFRATLSDSEAAKLDAFVLLTAADWYVVFCELVVADYPQPDPQRPFLKRAREIELLLYPEAASEVGAV